MEKQIKSRRKKLSKQRVDIRLDPFLYLKLKEFCEVHGDTTTSVIEQALCLFFENETEIQKKYSKINEIIIRKEIEKELKDEI